MACGGLVVLLTTLNAKSVATKTSDDINHTKITQLHQIFTRFHRAPFHILIQISELFTMPINILSIIIDAIIINRVF